MYLLTLDSELIIGSSLELTSSLLLTIVCCFRRTCFDSMIVGLVASSDREEVDVEEDEEEEDEEEEEEEDDEVDWIDVVADDVDDTCGCVVCLRCFGFVTSRFNCPCGVLDPTIGGGSSSPSKSIDIFISKFVIEAASLPFLQPQSIVSVKTNKRNKKNTREAAS